MVVRVHATTVGIVEEEDVAVLEPDSRVVGVVLEDVLDGTVVKQRMEHDAGRHPRQVTFRREHTDTEVACLQRLGHRQVLAHVSAVVDDRVELVQEDGQIDAVESIGPGQLQFGRFLEHFPHEHLGIDARPSR